ncbi:FadR/GntR family transcriptional regulator [Staphylococcus ratti]|uniref:FadR family transcriptional regulator n=1 Tax=Staphylococcus ratti TaxID=2892440 RepID=A0ABY3PEA9_9STAP|nr:FadR/GntR family transcriptional regulator [Staphylococcus ratti]UEX90654.1 FadR family transcriptional regulator [Staphylococcus ratti]
MKISNQKIYEQIANDLIEQIDEGKLKEGERLPSIQALAKTYGVSNASMREALNALRMIGLIEIKHGYGTFVKQKHPQLFDFSNHTLTQKRVKDILELREAVEVKTASLASQRRTEGHLAAMYEALNEMARAIQNNTSGEEADLKFHLVIAQASDNQLLYELLNNIADKIQQTMRGTRHIYLYSRQKRMEKLFNEHTAIYDAITTQNALLAAQKMSEHLQEVRQTLVENYIVE